MTMSKSEIGSLSVEDRVRREQAHFDSLADELGNVWWGHKTRAGQIRLDRRRLLVEQWPQIGPGAVVLEPGAGSGEFSSRLAMTGAQIVAVELSPKQTRIGSARLKSVNNLSFSVADVMSLPFANNSFDAVAGCSVLHHFHMPSALQEFTRVLKPGGRFLFSEPNMLNPQVAVEKNVPGIGRRLGNSPDETAFFRWRIAALLKRHGFVDIRVTPFDFLHPGTPDAWIDVVSGMSRVLERVPIVREFAGSLWISAVMGT
jgi:SAM-dependent methyltransferase